jgi:thioredoxin 1
MIFSIGEKNFNDEVLKSPIPVLVSFWAPWCGPCRIIEPVLLQLEGLFPSVFKLVRVNADENFWLAKNYRLTNLPTLMLFNQGQIIHRIDDQIINREDLLHTLKGSILRLMTSSDLAL